MVSLLLSIIIGFFPSNNLSNFNFLEDATKTPAGVSDFPYSFGPKLTAKSAIVIDVDSGKVLFEKNPEEKLPIASITKLMTALVFLENKTKSWEDTVEVKKEDSVGSGGFSNQLEPASLAVREGDILTVKDIFYGGLIKSANNAMKILARVVSADSGKNFVDLMNNKAQDLSMSNTHFEEPTGLDPKNYSTAQDLAKLIVKAMERSEIKEALEKKDYDVQIIKSDKSLAHLHIQNTDKLLGSFINIKGAKTGYIEESDYCLAALSQIDNHNLAVIILGAKTSENRFQEAKSLIFWANQQLNK
ncbi:MAG: serine hydrolase [Patescibacteria group bacterium]|jgi:D-alanyl-D-alanine carboxypeptidase